LNISFLKSGRLKDKNVIFIVIVDSSSTYSGHLSTGVQGGGNCPLLLLNFGPNHLNCHEFLVLAPPLLALSEVMSPTFG